MPIRWRGVGTAAVEKVAFATAEDVAESDGTREREGDEEPMVIEGLRARRLV